MKTLLLLRHAKSSWDDATLSDYDRPLNARGRIAAPFMGRLIHDRGYTPTLIVSSPALRARTTAELVREAAGIENQLVFDERIYEASPRTLIQVVSEIGETHDAAMLVGHNPGMERIIHDLTGSDERMPTAALAVLELKIEKWQEISAGCAKLVAVYRPRKEM